MVVVVISGLFPSLSLPELKLLESDSFRFSQESQLVYRTKRPRAAAIPRLTWRAPAPLTWTGQSVPEQVLPVFPELPPVLPELPPVLPELPPVLPELPPLFPPLGGGTTTPVG